MTFHRCEFCTRRGATLTMLLFALGMLAIVGCEGRPSIFPNSDPNLRKTSSQFAADAAKRHPYHGDAPRGGTITARAQVGYAVNKVEIENLSDTAWNDVEVWLNKDYVVFVPSMPPKELKVLPFQMIFDGAGNSFPIDNDKTKVTSLEVYKDGKMYDVTWQLAD